MVDAMPVVMMVRKEGETAVIERIGTYSRISYHIYMYLLYKKQRKTATIFGAWYAPWDIVHQTYFQLPVGCVLHTKKSKLTNIKTPDMYL